jgi:hypothetical protein
MNQPNSRNFDIISLPSSEPCTFRSGVAVVKWQNSQEQCHSWRVEETVPYFTWGSFLTCNISQRRMLGRSWRTNCKVRGKNIRGFSSQLYSDLYLEKTSKSTKTSDRKIEYRCDNRTRGLPLYWKGKCKVSMSLYPRYHVATALA